MRTTGRRPLLIDLYELIAKVPSYPVRARQLVNFAVQKQADQAVVNFYRNFPADQIFINKEDLLARSEQVELLNKEEHPPEEFRAPEED